MDLGLLVKRGSDPVQYLHARTFEIYTGPVVSKYHVGGCGRPGLSPELRALHFLNILNRPKVTRLRLKSR